MSNANFVLVVDDSNVQQLQIARVVSKLGDSMAHARNYVEAMQLFVRRPNPQCGSAR
jgi:CheY-like chemotaxis protein